MTTAAQRHLAERQRAAAAAVNYPALAERAHTFRALGKFAEAREIENALPVCRFEGPPPEFRAWLNALNDFRWRYEAAFWRAMATLNAARGAITARDRDDADAANKDAALARLVDVARQQDRALVALDRALERLATRYSFDAAVMRSFATSLETPYVSIFGAAEPGLAEVEFQAVRFNNIFPEVIR